MENENKENKEKTILNDEQLKNVDGGVLSAHVFSHCGPARNPEHCEKMSLCKWENGKCVRI